MHSKSIIAWLTANLSVLFWCLIIATTLLLLMEVSPSKSIFPHFDKIVHTTLFAALTGVGYLAYTERSTILYCSLAAYGALTELLQGGFTMTRYASVLDWMADLFGILLCISIIYILKKPTPIKINR